MSQSICTEIQITSSIYVLQVSCLIEKASERQDKFNCLVQTVLLSSWNLKILYTRSLVLGCIPLSAASRTTTSTWRTGRVSQGPAPSTSQHFDKNVADGKASTAASQPDCSASIYYKHRSGSKWDNWFAEVLLSFSFGTCHQFQVTTSALYPGPPESKRPHNLTSILAYFNCNLVDIF